MNNSKEEILKRIAAVRRQTKAAILFNDSLDEEIYQPVLPGQITCFKTELEAISGVCVVVTTKTTLYAELKNYLTLKNINKLFVRDNVLKAELEAVGVNCTNDTSNFDDMQAGATFCEFLIARTGSVVVTSHGDSGRQMNVFPPVHLVIASAKQLVNYPKDAYVALREKYKEDLPSVITTISGPSRTADIEKTLVLGAHGPKELVVFLSEE